MKVILKQDVEKLGKSGDIVKVAPGYGRNFLLPRKLAVPATPGNMKIAEIDRLAHARRDQREQGEHEHSGAPTNDAAPSLPADRRGATYRTRSSRR